MKPSEFLARVQLLVPASKSPGMAAEIIGFYEAGSTVETCATSLHSYLTRPSVLGTTLPNPLHKPGKPTSPALTAARLVRDYGKNKALHYAVHEADAGRPNSSEFAFWADVGTTLLEDL